jgi:NAD(P)H-hydrate repair Nnr-like enzyme with NAD(P)H-hydrate dehydratase domain
VAVVGGGRRRPGAVLLAGLAALRVGAGRLQVVTVDTTSVALAVSLPEAMVSGLPADEHGSLAPTRPTSSSTSSAAPARSCSGRAVRATASRRCCSGCSPGSATT